MEHNEIKKELSRQLKRKESQIKSLDGWLIAYAVFAFLMFFVFGIPDSFLNWMKRIAFFMGLFLLIVGIHHLFQKQKEKIKAEYDYYDSLDE